MSFKVKGRYCVRDIGDKMWHIVPEPLVGYTPSEASISPATFEMKGRSLCKYVNIFNIYTGYVQTVEYYGTYFYLTPPMWNRVSPTCYPMWKINGEYMGYMREGKFYKNNPLMYKIKDYWYLLAWILIISIYSLILILGYGTD